MHRVPVVLNTEYHRKIFENIPVLYVESFSLVDENFLIESENVWNEMQSFDVRKLDYKKIFENVIQQNIG